MDNNKVTLGDIAKRLNCSTSSVSRALNDKYGVSNETRANVRIAALEMGFDFRNITNYGKHHSKNGVTRINVVVNKTDLLDECFYLKIIYGIEKSLNSQKIEFSLSILEDEGEELWKNLKRTKADGVIILGLVSKKDIIAVLASGIPSVLVDTIHHNLKIDRLTVNNYEGTYEATKYLFNKGHRHIAFVGINNYSFSFDERYRGYYDCMKTLITKNPSDFELQDGSKINPAMIDISHIEKLLGGKNLPTAIVCANDRIAFKIYEVAKDFGLTIPDDLSLIGFDNIDKCEWVTPKLSSVHFPKNELGEEAVNFVLQRIAEKKKITRSTQFDTYLVERESVRDITKGKEQ